ncbi:DsrE/DsrF/DrsH-like family protein [Clostridium sp. D33t1_170424_F3]|uniref:DsrE/DsrF/DrsH-like family protein n=1 Tax=Clostridium sp. D33t1_170424_F3 TaxID=2787099 RepID=UPI0018ABE72F|nr:DsrE/DsrF/DrsH-like family protein [Clostridium sp. D33t1_170424_F3]
MKICIVGGVAGGASAATRLRRLSEDAEIVLFEKGEYISYANCGLPYYIGGSIKSRDALLVTKPELLRSRFRVDVRVQNEVLSIDRKAKTMQVRDHAAGKTYTESYDKLILSPGAEPKCPNLPGVELDGVFTLRTVPDTFRIDQYIREKNAASAVVVGGGFIGVEMAENLKERGLDVSIVEFADQVVAPLDKEMANLLHRHLAEHGVRLRLETGLTGIEEKDGALAVRLTKGEPLHADLVLLSMGVAPENRLAKEAGLQLGVGGSIAVNENYQTSDPDIYAVGDAIGVKNLVTGQENLVPLAGPANKQGRIAAENALGAQKTTGEGVQGSSVLKVFDLTAASTGLNEKQARAQGIAYRKTYVHPQSHASYYPGATPISMKLLFAEDGKVLGAQAVGYEGVEKRIDVLAAVIRLRGTVYDLEELELCYAPPYSSAKDPVNMLGFTAANILKGDMPVIYAEDVPALDPEQTTRLDVSMPEEVRMGTVPGFRNLPLDELRGRLGELDPKKPVYVTCRVGLRGYLATRILKQHGFDAYNLSGGYKTYQLVHAKNEFAEPPAPQKPEEERADHDVKTIVVDACGLQCPGPIMKVAEGMKGIAEGEQLCIRATDPAFASDIQAWCKSTGNRLLSVQNEKGTYEVVLQKGCGANPAPSCAIASEEGHDKTMVIFSGDLDKAIAAFIIANGAAAMGRKVTLFFTFWGLNILRRSEKVKVKKNVIEKMFGMMMPRGSKKLKLSKMHMAGAGSKMIREVMKSKNVSSLEELIQSAMDNGVRVVACQMSMDIMGIRAEELLDGVELGGVATFLGSAETSDTNLFI